MPWKIQLKKYVKELCKYGTCIGLSPSRQRETAPECESQLALKDLGKLWNSAYCSLIHFCVNEKHVLNLSREIRWISLLLSFCQCRFTVSTGIMVQPIPTCITSLCQENLRTVELEIMCHRKFRLHQNLRGSSYFWLQQFNPVSPNHSAELHMDDKIHMSMHWVQL